MSSTSNNALWETKNLSEPDVTEYRLQLNCSTNYDVMVIAWNERGSSHADGKSVSVRTEKGILICN